MDRLRDEALELATRLEWEVEFLRDTGSDAWIVRRLSRLARQARRRYERRTRKWLLSPA